MRRFETPSAALAARGVSTFRLVLVAVAATIAGCATSAYEAEHERWTRNVESFESFEARAFVDATLKVEAFRRAYVREYARIYSLTPTQESELLAAELEDDKKSLVVIVAFYTPERRWNDLNPAKGLWEVRLENGHGDYVQPSDVGRLDAKNPTWHALYPDFDVHDVLYELRFDRTVRGGQPLVASGDTLTLVIAGAPTRVRLSWQMP